MTVNVKFEFELGICNGTMDIAIVADGKPLTVLKEINDSRCHAEIQIPWPCRVELELSNKNVDFDTEEDEHGNIVAHKYVKLNHVEVNGFALIEQAMYNICRYRPDGQDEINEIFWSFPGKVTIDFDKDNPTRWNLWLNNVLYFREI